MTTWADIDALKAAPKDEPKGDKWRAFAKLANGEFRFRAKPEHGVIRVERPCFFRPGAWRFAAQVRLSQLDQLPERLRIAGFKRLPTDEQIKGVMVARDKWLEAGAPRMSRPTVIP